MLLPTFYFFLNKTKLHFLAQAIKMNSFAKYRSTEQKEKLKEYLRLYDASVNRIEKDFISKVRNYVN